MFSLTSRLRLPSGGALAYLPLFRIFATKSLSSMNELAANNPCIKFIVDNYDMLCRAHPGVLKKFISKKI